MRKYKDDYEIKIVEDEKGQEVKEVVYTGDHFELSADRETIKRFKRNSLLFFVFILLLHIGAGFVANQGMFTFYVSLPYVFVFLSLYFVLMGILRLPRKTKNLRRDEIGLSFDRMRTASNFLLPLLVAAVVGEVIFLMFFSSENQLGEVFFLILEALAALAAFGLFRMQKSINVRQMDKK